MRRRGSVAFKPIVLRSLGELTAGLFLCACQNRQVSVIIFVIMFLRQLAILVSALFVAACQGSIIPMLPSMTAYRIDIQQGNVVTQDMVAKLQPGMSRSQVRFVLGTPLVTDIFHPDRWDYIYRLEQGGRLVEHRRVVAIFSSDKLLRVEGDVVPATAAAAKPVALPAQPAQESKPLAEPVEKK